MSKRILIINRGEIAIRVAKAINELGFISVGVWTDNEPAPMHLQYCKEWVHLAGANNKETYLAVDKIVEIIKKYKIAAVHPGYGFLSENSKFVKKIEELGVIFIGPNSRAIDSMGDKATSKKIAQKAGVPVVPGSVGVVSDTNEALKIAQQIGFPVLLKASAGGGGKGMRVCTSAEEVKRNFEAVQREAMSSFGDDGVLVEKYVLNPHHIEVQILADKKGNVYHLFERECSVQRRHQKVVEEAPSPFIGNDETLRRNICETAVKLAQAVGYDSAGTVEFIMGDDRQFYFLEMNTRIQVEHPITEEITGLDLVANMIKSAFGMKLDISKQDDIKKFGHSIECRICAEDPVTMLPAPGVVSGFDTLFPQGVRFDHCIYEGLEVTPDFDPMIGKLVVSAVNRDVAMDKMICALAGLKITGLKNNIALHEVIMRDEKFRSGTYTTKYLEETKPQLRVDVKVDLKDEKFVGELIAVATAHLG